MNKPPSEKRAGKPAVPDGRKLYAVGDIHGCADLLDALLEKIDKDARGIKNATLIFLGDYVDRGPDSKGVLDRLVQLGDGKQDCIFLKGNHEAVMLDFLDDPEEMLHWLDWGGEETLLSYGLRGVLRRSAEELGENLRAAMPAAHLDFLRALPLTHIEGDYLFVHAGLRPGVPLEDQEEEDLLWIRHLFHDAAPEKRPAHIVVHGHQPLRRPLDAGWRIDVDTGACWSGALTAVALEGDKRRFIST
jgi:serine/threonine protein phosphatase 1